MKNYLTVSEIAKKLKISRHRVKMFIDLEKIDPNFCKRGISYFEENVVFLIKNKLTTIYKPVYIHSKELIIPSKLNFLNFDQL